MLSNRGEQEIVFELNLLSILSNEKFIKNLFSKLKLTFVDAIRNYQIFNCLSFLMDNIHEYILD